MTFKALWAVNRLARCRQSYQLNRCFASSTKEHITADETPVYEDIDSQIREEEIERKRNKSGLTPYDRQILLGQQPKHVYTYWWYNTLKYKRRMLGRYGTEGSDVPAGIAWPTVQELEEAKEYERVAYPMSLHECWAEIEKKHKEEEDQIQRREKAILAGLEKMDEWKMNLQKRLEKKLQEKEAAIQQKQNLIEAVRREFGYKISIYDARFKEAFERKEKELKQQKKEIRKKMRADKLQAQFNIQEVKNRGTPDKTDESKIDSKDSTEDP